MGKGDDGQTPVAATYYPHTSIRSEGLLKASLLLWDEVECVIPAGPIVLTPNPKRFAEAKELVVRRRRPTDVEKQRVHRRLESLLSAGVPSWLRLTDERSSLPSRPYLIYPEKFASETWRLFEQYGLADWQSSSSDYAVPPALGLLCMAMLADECAGTEKRRVTDRAVAYSWLSGIMTLDEGGEYLPTLNASHLAPTYDRLVTLSLATLGAEGVPLERLLEMRRREAKSNSNDYRELRKRYLLRLDQVIARLTAEDTRPTDVKEIERQFRADMRDDLLQLKRELRLNATKALLSKEMLLAVVALAGNLAFGSQILSPSTGLDVVGVGALVKTGVEYRAGRRKALRERAMSWLFLAR